MQPVQSTVLVVGPRKVGKSDIINHLTNGSFNSEYYPNNGQDYSVKLARVPQTLSFSVTKIFEVQPIYWDGKELGLISFYAQISDVILLVVDITSLAPLDELIDSIYCAAKEKLTYEYFSEIQDIPKMFSKIVIFGNCRGRRQQPNKILTVWLSGFCSLNQVPLFEVDSTSQESILTTFEHILDLKKREKPSFSFQNCLQKTKRYFYPLVKANELLWRGVQHIMDDIANLIDLLQ